MRYTGTPSTSSGCTGWRRGRSGEHPAPVEDPLVHLTGVGAARPVPTDRAQPATAATQRPRGCPSPRPGCRGVQLAALRRPQPPGSAARAPSRRWPGRLRPVGAALRRPAGVRPPFLHQRCWRSSCSLPAAAPHPRHRGRCPHRGRRRRTARGSAPTMDTSRAERPGHRHTPRGDPGDQQRQHQFDAAARLEQESPSNACSPGQRPHQRVDQRGAGHFGHWAACRAQHADHRDGRQAHHDQPQHHIRPAPTPWDSSWNSGCTPAGCRRTPDADPVPTCLKVREPAPILAGDVREGLLLGVHIGLRVLPSAISRS